MEQKTDIPGLYKAGEGVLINKDNTALQAYKRRKERERTIDQFGEEIGALRKDIDEIKALLTKLVK